MTDEDQKFAVRAIGRKRLFLGLSIAGLVIGFSLVILYSCFWWFKPGYPIGPRLVIVLLVLLNARQNLRQYKFARILEGFMPPGAR